MTSLPWDCRIAHVLVRPLRHTPVRPNHITTLNMLMFLVAGLLFTPGTQAAANWGAGIFVLAALLDHSDGALARLTGTTSRLGHYYDHFAGAVGYVTLFLGIGVGGREGPLGNASVALGAFVAVSVAVALVVRLARERRHGAAALDQPTVGGFEIEDAMYLIGPVTWLGLQRFFLLAAGIGAPLFTILLLFGIWRNARRSGPPPATADDPGPRP